MASEKLDPGSISALVKSAQDGDTEAFGRLYDHFFPQVYRYAALRVPAAVAEDLTAEIFVKVWEKLAGYEERTNVPFGAWLFRIARNMVVDAYRTARTWEEIPDDLSDPDEWNRADDRVRRVFLLKTVRKALSELPRRYREVLELTYIADLPHAEAAGALKISEGSLRIRKFRALKKLEAILPPEFKENM
jgi:RNA polymerase sigma-70 factor (ECF subfamily)